MRPLLCFLLAATIGFATTTAAGPIEERLDAALRDVPAAAVPSGVLYDRVLPLSGLERFDGGASAPAASAGLWRQAYDELRRAALGAPARPPVAALDSLARGVRDAMPVALLLERYDRIRDDAIERGALVLRDGRLEPGAGGAFAGHTAFLAAALGAGPAGPGPDRFVLDPRLCFAGAGTPLDGVAIDLGDGLGFRPVRFGETVEARDARRGGRVVRVRARTGSDVMQAAFAVPVRAQAAPAPDDTLHVTASIPFDGAAASGDAYVYLAPGRTSIVNPVVVVEGFDIDNSMNWDELYALLDQQGLIETLRADGYDAVVLNFADATDYLQRNAFVVVELLQQVQAAAGPQASIGLAGASMGGLLGRYALAYMETHGLPHHVRTFLSFDGPQLGADIPLGIQHWFSFFSGQSADAAALLAKLNRPAARQMLVYHYSATSGGTGHADPLRASFLADLAAAGDWPALTRRVAVANGSGAGAGQPFAPGAQLIRWEYSSFGTAFRGDIWAVPDNTPTTKIFDGLIKVLFITLSSQTLNVAATLPYDDAPGGTRATMTQMDTTAAPYGDIVALYPSHCFIPTVSALCFSTPDLFHDVLGDPAPLTHTPFDAIYAPAANQEHVAITAENAEWIRTELEAGVTGVPPGTGRAELRLAAGPSPGQGPLDVRFVLPRSGGADVRVFALDGREVARLASGRWDAGEHAVRWDGAAAPGVYFVRLVAEGRAITRRAVRLR